MRKKRGLGFTIVETLIVSVFVASTLILLYTQVSRVEDSYGRTFTYNTTEGLYNAKKIKDYFVTEKSDILASTFESTSKGYIKLSDCSSEVFQNDYSELEYCNLLYEKLNVKDVFLVSHNTTDVATSLRSNQKTDKISEGLIKFVKSIKKVDTGSYLVIEYKNNTYSSVYFAGISGEVEPVVPAEPGADGASIPTLTDNLVAVEISEAGVVTVADTSNTNWYNYDESKWANAVILNNGVDTPSVGSTVAMSDINQMYVWIPRYKYSNITTADKPITIEFVDKTVTDGVHPAFSFEEDGEISGIWVGKFELSEDYKIIPNVNSVLGKDVVEFYNDIKALNTDGSENIHMLKNTEWGAAAYLSQSKYGICTDTECSGKVQNNNYFDDSTYNITTGCGGDDTPQAASGEICPDTNRWTTDNGKGASTTHNITGIYDMAGGRFEYVMAAQYDSSAKDNLNVSESNFDQDILNGLSSKFVDKYDFGTTTSNTNRNILGDATEETVNWNDDYSNFIANDASWFLRGGHVVYEDVAGIWAYDHAHGFSIEIESTRSAIFGQ